MLIWLKANVEEHQHCKWRREHFWKGTFLNCFQTSGVYLFSAGRTLSLQLTRSPKATGSQLQQNWTWSTVWMWRWARRLLCTARTARRLGAARGAGSSLLRTVRRGVSSSSAHYSGPKPPPQSELWFSMSLPSWLRGRAWTEVTDSGIVCHVAITTETCWVFPNLWIGHFVCYCFQTRTVWIGLDGFLGKTKRKCLFLFFFFLLSNSLWVQGMIYVFNHYVLCVKKNLFIWIVHRRTATLSFDS